MDIKDFSISLRSEINGLITGIQNAGFSLYWDNTTPNYVTKHKLEKIYDRYLKIASAYGVYLVTRHSNCPYKSHQKYVLEGSTYDYMMTNSYGLNIEYRDPRYLWEGDQRFQGKRISVCPCSPDKSPVELWIIEDIIYDKQVNLEEAKKINSVLHDLYNAIKESKDKHPRSGIREYLLRAVLQLNDLILPIPMEIYIKNLSTKDEGQ